MSDPFRLIRTMLLTNGSTATRSPIVTLPTSAYIWFCDNKGMTRNE
ncbi:hypothetical protein L798_10915 [Zootermopsis nevadensis]|uniref:Uncharacterized protein n=1 Tax=Zootermopsis nevadensis TaxID=136037 RepID=A0A067RGZ9_ZOONE|nr:hypothetical protein L798_10915 [Zootermopsis nevadensis]